MLKELLEATEVTEKDNLNTALLKGVAVGLLEGLTLVGGAFILTCIFTNNKKWELSNGGQLY